MDLNKEFVDKMWHDWFMKDANTVEKQMPRLFHFLPHDPRCKICNAPFQGIGGVVVGTLFGRRQSGLNPQFCNICEDFAKKFPGGAEVEMAMLFADVRGSTALSESMSPLEFQKLINRFFIHSSKAITDEYGLLEKLAGDAVAAFWGAGFAGKEYAARTVRAAQKISQQMQKQNIPVGIGVHAGVAYFGAMGEENGLVNISAIGDEVNTAARLASKAAAGEIIVSEKALDKAGMSAVGLEARSLELKGISKPLAVRVMRGF
ncbi:MAG: adenylate/guanylate cyclase domain-containing protein [Anaerolineales bacterium]|nr:adenylate/guanylate cyclase domain-containing protein [Anaerolineales bacterium]